MFRPKFEGAPHEDDKTDEDVSVTEKVSSEMSMYAAGEMEWKDLSEEARKNLREALKDMGIQVNEGDEGEPERFKKAA